MSAIDWSAIIGSLVTWVVYALISYLANKLPHDWALTQALARAVYAGKRWELVPAQAPLPAAAPTPAPSSEQPTLPAAGLYPPQAPDKPSAPRIAILPVLLMALVLSGCSMSLQSARAPRAVDALQDPTCDAIDREHSIATAGAAILGGLAGAGGLTSIPVGDDDVRSAFVVGASAAGVGALGLGLWAQDRAERYQRRCAP